MASDYLAAVLLVLVVIRALHIVVLSATAAVAISFRDLEPGPMFPLIPEVILSLAFFLLVFAGGIGWWGIQSWTLSLTGFAVVGVEYMLFVSIIAISTLLHELLSARGLSETALLEEIGEFDEEHTVSAKQARRGRID